MKGFSLVNSLRNVWEKSEFIVVFPRPCSVLFPFLSVFQIMPCDISVVSASASRTWGCGLSLPSGLRRAALGRHSEALSFLGLVEIVFCGGGSCGRQGVLQQPCPLGAPGSFACVSLQLCKVSDSTLCACAFQTGLKIGIFQKIVSNFLEIIVKGSRNPV